MPKQNTYIALMRHGEPIGGRKYRGQQDDPLSDNGWEQMQHALKHLRQDWDVIITSPLSRCQNFAQSLGEQKNIPVICNKQLKEIGMGDWEGKTVHEIKQVEAQAYENFFLDPINQRPKNSESLEPFYNRIVESWEKILLTYSHQNILVIAHAGVLRAIVCYILKAPIDSLYRLRFKNAALIQIDIPVNGQPMINF